MNADECRQSSREFVEYIKRARPQSDGSKEEVIDKLSALTEESKVVALYEVAAQLAILNTNLKLYFQKHEDKSMFEKVFGK